MGDKFSDEELLRIRWSYDVWTCFGGEVVKLEDMTTSHLRNAISWIEAHGDYCVFGYGALWLPKLRVEKERRNLKLKEDF